MQPDLVPGALADEAVASVTGCLFVIEGPRLRDNFTQSLRRSAWGILFEAVMQLDNFCIEFRAQDHARLLGQPEKQVDADAEIRRAARSRSAPKQLANFEADPANAPSFRSSTVFSPQRSKRQS